ncbi:radical SAM protein [candidate division KSB1 bacterium]|nr:radical SAM protein [candidate division KSB1 bacterium]
MTTICTASKDDVFAINSLMGERIPVNNILDNKFWRDLDFYCKCDCITPSIIPRDIPALPDPKICYLELTTQCNQRCAGCTFCTENSPAATNRTLNIHEWKIILKKLAPGIQRIQLTGGEPTLYPHFYELIQIIEQMMIPYVIFTNGCWNEPARLLAFLKACKNFRGFLISLHGATAQTHEKFTKINGTFERTVQNIRLAVKSGLSIFTSSVIFQDNASELITIPKFAQNLGAEYSIFNRYIGHAPAEIFMEPSKLKEALQGLELLIQKGAPVRFGNCIPQCFIPTSSSGCLAGTAFMSIDAYGNLKPCNHANIKCGNLVNQSLPEIWNSPMMSLWRQAFSPNCLQCAQFSNCHGGCRAEAFRMGTNEDPLIPHLRSQN